jgi:hypothetical protein
MGHLGNRSVPTALAGADYLGCRISSTSRDRVLEPPAQNTTRK